MKTFKENNEDQELGWQDIINAKTADELNEVSLGRVYQHVQREKLDSWCIITSYRDENKPAKNKSDFKRLQHQIRSANLGFFKLVGHGQEEDEDWRSPVRKGTFSFCSGYWIQTCYFVDG